MSAPVTAEEAAGDPERIKKVAEALRITAFGLGKSRRSDGLCLAADVLDEIADRLRSQSGPLPVQGPNRTCATCRFWGKEWQEDGPVEKEASGWGAGEARALGAKYCGAVPMLTKAAQWDRSEDLGPDEEDRVILTPAAEGVTAFVMDGSDYYADLYTCASHYCSMHAPPAPGQDPAAGPEVTR